MFYIPNLNFAVDKIENNQMFGACNLYGGGENLIQVFGWESWGKGY